MGFSVSGATAIILIGLLISGVAFVPAVQESVTGYSTSVETQSDRALAQGNTNISFESVVYNATTQTLTVTVTNGGTTSLETESTSMLVDGQFTTPTTAINGDSSRSLWSPGTTLTLQVSVTDPNRVVVVAETGNSIVRDGITGTGGA